MEKKNNEYLGQEGYALMGAAFEVHKELNGGLAEDGAQSAEMVNRDDLPETKWRAT
jgi:hypothetical protein